MHDIIEYSLKQRFYTDKGVNQYITSLEKEIKLRHIPAISAARKLLNLYHNN
jgi:hypothetical protein